MHPPLWATLLPLACTLQACIESAHAPTQPSELSLSATDFRGAAQDLEQLPRRPRLRLRSSHALDPASDAYVLFAGQADAVWTDDLARAPLREEHDAERIPFDVESTLDALWLVPRSALAAGREHVFAIAAWGKSRRGAALTGDAGPRLYSLHTAAGPDAGARVQATWPFAGASAVARDLRYAVVAVDGRVFGAEAGVWLQGPDGLAVDAHIESGPCAELAPEQSSVHCVRLRPRSSLAGDAQHRLIVGEGALDAHGAPVGPFTAEFRTSLTGDTSPPGLRAPTCAADEQTLPFGCALIDDTSVCVRGLTDEAAIILMSADGLSGSAVRPAGPFDIRVSGLPPDREFTLELQASDAGGRAVVHQVPLRTTEALATVSISELLADPLGPEPEQEWVELFNYGDRSLDLHGFTLVDRPDGTGQALATASLLLPAQSHALLVAEGYDARGGADIAPDPGVLVLRLGRALTGSGLTNSGEALVLRDARGRRVSASPSQPRPSSGVCLARTSSDPREGGEGSFARAACSPGR